MSHNRCGKSTTESPELGGRQNEVGATVEPGKGGMMPQIPLDEILQVLKGRIAWMTGPETATVSTPAPIGQVPDTGGISFCTAAPDTAPSTINASSAEVIVCRADVAKDQLDTAGKTVIGVDNPRQCFIRIVSSLFTPTMERGIHPTAIVHPEAKLGDNIHIGPYACLGICSVGDGSIIHGAVQLGDGTAIGRNVIVHPGTVIGTDGFGYERNEDGEMEKFPHIGGVVIEDDAEIGANTCIDRGTLGNTRICRGAKIDNLVHIAHNVVVGRDSVVIAHAMIGGSVDIGDRAWVAPGAIVRNAIGIGADAVVGLGAVVTKTVPANTTVIGNPARPFVKK